MYQSAGGIVPCRFLILMAHLITTITLLWTRDDNVKACLPLQYTEAQYRAKDTQLTIGLSLAIVLLFYELCSFFSGISMFSPLTSLLSIISHAGACVSLFYFVSDEWDCDLYWWIFALSCVLPTLTESIALVRILIFKKGL
ncbi:hypothetical protein CHUAL_000870 [Chamberlinius hualienensis]